MDKKELIFAILCFAVGGALMVFVGNSVSPKIGNLLASYYAPPATADSPEIKQSPANEPAAPGEGRNEKAGSEIAAQSQVSEKTPEPPAASGKTPEAPPRTAPADAPQESAPEPIDDAPEKADTVPEIKPEDTKPTIQAEASAESDQAGEQPSSDDAEQTPPDQPEKPAEMAANESPDSGDKKQTDAGQPAETAADTPSPDDEKQGQADVQSDQRAETAADSPSPDDEKQEQADAQSDQPAETAPDDEKQTDAEDTAPAQAEKETAETPSQADAHKIKSPEEVKKLTADLKNGESLDLGDGRIAYKVKSGDTFSQICKKVLGTSSTWKKEAEKMGIDYRKLSLGQVLIFEK